MYKTKGIPRKIKMIMAQGYPLKKTFIPSPALKNTVSNTESDDESLRASKKPPVSFGGATATLLWLTLGLIVAGIWTNLVGYSVDILPSHIAEAPEAFNRDAFFWGRLFTGIILIVFAKFVPRIQTVLVVSVALAMSFSTGIIVISFNQTLFDPELFSFVGIFLSGCGQVFLIALFYIHFAQKIKESHIIISIAISLVCETVFSIVFSLNFTASAEIPIVIAAPLLIGVCFFLASFSSKDLMAPEVPVKAVGLSRNLLVAQTVVLAILLVLLRGLGNVGVWGEKRDNFTGMTELSVLELVLASFLILLLTYLIFILPRKRLSLQLRCLLGFLVLLAGLQILALINDYFFTYSFYIVTTAADLFANLVFWMVVIDCIRRTDVSPFRVVSISLPLSALASLAWIHYFEKPHISSIPFVMVLIYILLLVVCFVFFNDYYSKTQQKRDDNERHDKILLFAQRKLLSSRESEIFLLLMEGKKRLEIEQICGLSEGTVKTHITSIYRKLDIHSKSDMVKLFNKEERIM